MIRVHTPIPVPRSDRRATTAHAPIFGVPTMAQWEAERDRRAAAPLWRRLIGKA